jgi:hypothetical protein
MKWSGLAAGLLALVGTGLAAEPVHAESQWHAIFDRAYSEGPTSSFRDASVPAIAAFLGQVYIGTGTHGLSNAYATAHIHRLVGEECRIWEDVSPPWEPAWVPDDVVPFWWSSLTGGDVMSLRVFNQYLYLATEEAEVLRSGDGLTWENVTGNWFDFWPPHAIARPTALAELDGHLYVAFDSVEIWRTDGVSWSPVVGPPPALHGSGFDESGWRDLQSLAFFKGHLYAGVGKDNINGIQLWRTKDGLHWEKYKELSQTPQNLFPPGHVHALKEFKGVLHVGDAEGVGIYRTDGSVKPDGTAKVWTYHSKVAPGRGIRRFAERAGTLFLGMYNFAVGHCPGCALVHHSSDGEQWQPVPGSPVNDQDHQYVRSMLASSVTRSSAGPKLYVGTSSSEPQGRLLAYQYGPSPGSCVPHAVKTAVHDLSQRIGQVQKVLERCAEPPCLLGEVPLVRPIPPRGDEYPDDFFEAPLAREIVEAAESEMQVAPGDEDLQDRVLEDLRAVRSILIRALPPLQEDSGGDEVLDPGIDGSAVDNAIAALDWARSLCHEASVLLSQMSGGRGPAQAPARFRR